MVENKVSQLVELPVNKKSIRRGFTHKYDEDSKSYKARFVARGFSQITGEDFDQNFAPVKF